MTAENEEQPKGCDAWYHGERGCICQGGPEVSDLIAWHAEQVELLRPFRRSSSHFKAAMMHAATLSILRASAGEVL